MHRKHAGLGLALALMSGAAQLPAQDITIGLKGGIIIADLAIDDAGVSEQTGTRTAFAIGPFVEFGISDLFSVQPEVLYTQKGTKDTEDGIDLTFKLNYIEVPVLLKARLSSAGSTVLPSVYAGPVFAFESKCEVEGSDGGATVTVDCNDEELLGLETKSVDFGVALGAGISIPTGSVVIVGDVRYTLGLSDINDTAGFEELDVKNRTWAVLFGVGLPL
ncbi:MAG: PorT family protein [Gemmatimonadales bacterium]|nr:MAG: PorT family protein [Gemmatimonadales bacterium]